MHCGNELFEVITDVKDNNGPMSSVPPFFEVFVTSACVSMRTIVDVVVTVGGNNGSISSVLPSL